MKKNKRGNDIFQSIVHPIMLFLYKATVGPVIAKLMFNSRASGLKLSKVKGPFILIGNHVNNYDSLVHQFYAGRIISFVVNERIFRMGPNGALGKLMTWLHYIPKKKFATDLKAVRKLFRSKEEGRIIGIFPEGRRNWDGAPEKIISSISTLAKSLKVPIVAAITKGGFSSQPRWSNQVRRGCVEIEYKMVMDEETVRQSSADEILETIIKELDFKEYDYLNNKKIFFKSKEPAEGLERMLFMCPSCHKMEKLTSFADTVKCECGYMATYDNYGQLHCEHFANLAEWNSWQKNELKNIKYAVSEEAVFTDYDITLSTVSSASHEKLKITDCGTAILFRDKIVFEGNKRYEFPLSGIWGCNIQQNRSFEFNHGDTMYLFTFPGKGNAYKWTVFVEL